MKRRRKMWRKKFWKSEEKNEGGEGGRRKKRRRWKKRRRGKRRKRRRWRRGRRSKRKDEKERKKRKSILSVQVNILDKEDRQVSLPINPDGRQVTQVLLYLTNKLDTSKTLQKGNTKPYTGNTKFLITPRGYGLFF